MIRSIAQAPINLFKKYNQAILRSPYKTKMATAGVTYFLADNICQRFIEKKSKHSYSLDRSCRQGAIGALFAAPSLHIWHSSILPKVIKPIAGRFKPILLAVLLNETVLATYFISFLLFSFEAVKKGNIRAGVENVKTKFSTAIVTSMKFWTGISFINYGFIPIHLRPIYVNCWSVVWQSYLSYVANNKITETNQNIVEKVIPSEEDNEYEHEQQIEQLLQLRSAYFQLI